MAEANQTHLRLVAGYASPVPLLLYSIWRSRFPGSGTQPSRRSVWWLGSPIALRRMRTLFTASQIGYFFQSRHRLQLSGPQKTSLNNRKMSIRIATVPLFPAAIYVPRHNNQV